MNRTFCVDEVIQRLRYRPQTSVQERMRRAATSYLESKKKT